MNPDLIMSNTAGISSIVALWLYSASALMKRHEKQVGLCARGVLIITFLSVSGLIVKRGIDAARFPIANMYESLLLFAWGLLAAFLFLQFVFNLKHLGWLTALAVSAVFLYTSWLPPSQQAIQPLMPALVSYWRAIHVPPLIVSYAFLVLAGLSALLSLFYLKRLKTAGACLVALAVSAVSIGLGTTGSASVLSVQILFWAGSALSLALIAFFLKQEWRQEIPDTEIAGKLDDISQRCIGLAFPLLTFGIITGAFWANHAWGAYWSWDPKESMSLVTWLFYAAYLHMRVQFGNRSDLVAVIAFVGLLATLLTYLGFNFLGFGGLHSYGQLR